MADGNIFQQYLQAPKSVSQYAAEYDQADARKQSLQQNALELAAGQQKYDDGQQARQRAAQLRQTLMGLPVGANDDQRIQAMRSTGLPEGYAAADALDKSMIERRKGIAAADKDDAETATKKLAQSVALHNFQAQKLAGVQSPADALAWADESNALGLFSQPGQYEQGVARIQSVAQDPQAFAQWKTQAMQGGQGITQQLEQQFNQLKQQEQVRQFSAGQALTRSEGAANRGNQIAIQNMIGARQDKKDADDASGLSDATKLRIAQQFVDAGDVSGLKNLGRGTQGAKDLRGIQNAITDYAAQKGMSPSEISAKIADFDGLKVGLRTSANISARVENAIAEADELAPLAVEAGRRVARSGFLPFGRMQVMFNNQTNDPDMNRFATANIGLATAYAGAMARGQKPTVHDKEHAEKVIGEAKSQQAYEAVVDQLILEMAAAKRAPHKVRDSLRGEISGKAGPAHAAPSATPAAPSDIDALLKKYGGK